eukprot:CAMPEP_0202362756 /NCGR_PEP_ID=MMETSP1126-20121109/14817_1 /ASSEMBLY_ACC=CAM_ASM_000457 /TAXON_ID=3047 /ORGANISM="Dunaliella tertiolecta, Strain CCMP1320" /LENGTH=37 /DNA_ID= /DNA_START= /DNA_END= /DNA_ORIENTATION=
MALGQALHRLLHLQGSNLSLVILCMPNLAQNARREEL